MASKDGLCLWCGRWTETKAEDGLADCDRPDCIAKRDYSDEPQLKPKTDPNEGMHSEDVHIFFVGGCVRDAMLDVRTKDIDFAVEAPSYEAMRDFVLARGNIFQERPEHFTIRAHVKPYGAVDFVLCRKDGPYSDGRRPDYVEPGTLADDLARRDFTVNAMARTLDGELIDLHNGVSDLRDRVLVFVGDPKQRLHEDCLRAFRAVRFAVTKGFSLDRTTFDAIASMTMADFEQGLKPLPADRIRDELTPAFGKDTRRTLEWLHDLPILLDVTLDRGIWLRPTNEQP